MRAFWRRPAGGASQRSLAGRRHLRRADERRKQPAPGGFGQLRHSWQSRGPRRVPRRLPRRCGRAGRSGGKKGLALNPCFRCWANFWGQSAGQPALECLARVNNQRPGAGTDRYWVLLYHVSLPREQPLESRAAGTGTDAAPFQAKGPESSAALAGFSQHVENSLAPRS